MRKTKCYLDSKDLQMLLQSYIIGDNTLLLQSHREIHS